MSSVQQWAGRGASSVVIATGLVLAGPGVMSQGADSAAPSTLSAGDQTDAEINRSLDLLAKHLAAAADGAGVRSSIHNEVGKRFDGDTEALWSSVAAAPAFSASVLGGKNGDRIARAAAEVPGLQVAVPVHFQSWDPATYTPLVAYFPEGVEDTLVSTIKAYDTRGNAVWLDAKVEPTHPVIVLSRNERTDSRGRVLEPVISSSEVRKPDMAPTASRYSVDMRIVHLIDDKEPWAKGDAEIALKARSRGCSGTEYLATNWENLNHNDDWWAPGGTRNLGLTTCDVVFYWWEDDGGAVDFTLAYGGFSLGVAMDDDDDLIGGKQIPHASFSGSTMRVDEWPALAQWSE